ncbi:MAG: MBOAT family protein [Lachnospiraceae bacterium]|nr:MBOAT family protein [Lachnospiraceae bacterium]
MNVTSYFFVLVFIPIVITVWRLLLQIKYHSNVLAVLFLTFMSLWFIGSYDYRFVLIMLTTVTINYYTMRFSKNLHNTYPKKIIAITLVVINLSVLLILKYANWVRELFLKIDQPWNLILPIGISFYTLEQIMFIVDNYRCDKYDYSFVEYLSYSTFFPTIVSGPIMKHFHYMEQLKTIKETRIPEEKIKQGIISFSLGYGKKLLIASQLGLIVDFGYSNLDAISAGALIICIISYALQLYFDFSGYCNIVEGIGLMMGFELPVNFTSPYKAASIGEFWKKWHKTLTDFLTKYVYIPLGGNRKGRIRQAVNIMIVFLLSGLWHGASLTFLLWGGAHGICMIIDKYVVNYWNRLTLWFRKGTTFIIVALLWIPFRANTLHHARDILFGLSNLGIDTVPEFYQTMLPQTVSLIKAAGLLTESSLFTFQKIYLIVFVGILLAVALWGKDVTYLREKYSSKLWMMALSGLILSISVMQFSTVTPSFIYEGF